MSASEGAVVTIAIPAFGDSALLREAISSVVAQDVESWVLQVVDDGPADGELSEWVSALDPRISYSRNKDRLGINRNFQRCLDRAQTDLVVLLGADDRLLPAYVRTMVRTAAAYPTAAWIHPRVQVVDEAGKPGGGLADRMKSALAIHPPAYLGGELLAASLLRGNWMYFPSVAFRTSIVQRYGFRPGYDIVLDLDLYVRMLCDGQSAVLVEPVCFEYRRHRESLSSTQRHTGQRFAEEAAYFAEVAADMGGRGWTRAARAARWHLTSRLHAAALAPASVAGGQWSAAGRLLRHAIT